MELVTAFFQLKEYDSLCREMDQINKEKTEQIDRLKKRENDLALAKNEVTSTTQAIRSLENEYFELERKLEQRLSESAKNEFESKALSLLTDLQTQETALEEKALFLSGFEKTVKEITDESNIVIKELELKARHTHERASQLLISLPEDFQLIIKKTQQRNLSIGNFTKIQDGKCLMCRYKLSLDQISEIDQQYKLKACSGCSRIFLPYSVASGTRV